MDFFLNWCLFLFIVRYSSGPEQFVYSWVLRSRKSVLDENCEKKFLKKYVSKVKAVITGNY